MNIFEKLMSRLLSQEQSLKPMTQNDVTRAVTSRKIGSPYLSRRSESKTDIVAVREYSEQDSRSALRAITLPFLPRLSRPPKPTDSNRTSRGEVSDSNT